MLPNAFVILWDNQPTGFDYKTGGLRKVKDANEVKFWHHRISAEAVIDLGNNKNFHMRIVEVQFNIISF